MKYRNTVTGVEYNVTNEALLPMYETDGRFVKVVEKQPVEEKKAAEPAKKTTKKK